MASAVLIDLLLELRILEFNMCDARSLNWTFIKLVKILYSSLDND